jgi:uncharacterized phage-associated protein
MRIHGYLHLRHEMGKLMANAEHVAQFFLSLSEPDEGDFISNLKLQKLCYYAQGFTLAMLARPLFADDIFAWDHGPVVPRLYHLYKEHGSQAIPVPHDFDPDVIAADEAGILREVWDVYGQFSAWKLRNMTHAEAPWKETPRGSVISHEALRQFFRTRLAGN